MDAHDRNDLDRLVQRYLDGDLPGPRATRLFLDAQQDAKLTAELETYRRLFSVLDGLPRAEPPDGFDERVLATVPYDLYAGAPRKAWPQLVLGSRPLAWLGALGHRAVHLHLSDNRGTGDDHLGLGSGSVPWEDLPARLAALGFQGTVVLEVYSRAELVASRRLLERAASCRP